MLGAPVSTFQLVWSLHFGLPYRCVGRCAQSCPWEEEAGLAWRRHPACASHGPVETGKPTSVSLKSANCPKLGTPVWNTLPLHAAPKTQLIQRLMDLNKEDSHHQPLSCPVGGKMQGWEGLGRSLLPHPRPAHPCFVMGITRKLSKEGTDSKKASLNSSCFKHNHVENLEAIVLFQVLRILLIPSVMSGCESTRQDTGKLFKGSGPSSLRELPSPPAGRKCCLADVCTALSRAIERFTNLFFGKLLEASQIMSKHYSWLTLAYQVRSKLCSFFKILFNCFFLIYI